MEFAQLGSNTSVAEYDGFLFFRCWISECETQNSNNFTTQWLQYAVPYQNGHPDRCNRYQFIATADNSTSLTCSASNFNRSNVIRCEEFIIKNYEQHSMARVGQYFDIFLKKITIKLKCTSHFQLDLLCTGQDSKIRLLGTTHLLGILISIPATRVISYK